MYFEAKREDESQKANKKFHCIGHFKELRFQDHYDLHFLLAIADVGMFSARVGINRARTEGTHHVSEDALGIVTGIATGIVSLLHRTRYT